MSVFIERFGSGPNIILLHGWGLHGGLWSQFADELAKNFSVSKVDLPGHGHSSKPKNKLTIESITQSIHEQLDKESSKPATVLGWSLGGFIALELAALYPDKFDRLVWIAGTPSFVQRPDWPVGMAKETLAGFADGLKKDYRLTLKRFISLNGGKGGDRVLLKAMQDQVFERGEPTVETLDQGLQILMDSDQRQRLASVSQDMLMVQGTSDRLVHPDTISAVEKIRSVESYLIEGAGHAPFLSDPIRTAAAIQEFMR